MPYIVVFLFIFLIIGVPIGLAFGLSALIGGSIFNIPLNTFASVANQAVKSFPLLAIPLFVLAGHVMSQAKIVRHLINVSDLIIGKVKGSLGYVTVITSAFMGAITGSSVATVSAVGTTIGEEMTQKGYKRGYVASLIAGAGLLGVLIPPSIPLILYGATVGVSVANLFLGAILPGLLMIVAFLIVHRLLLNKVYTMPTHSNKDNDEVDEKSNEKSTTNRKSNTLLKAIPALFMPIIILGGIYSGIFTPTEAAAVAVLYGILIAIISKAVKFKDLTKTFYISAISSAAILSIIAFSNMFNHLITLERIPQMVSEYAITVTDSPVMFLLLAFLILFVVGMFMETNAAVLLMGVLLTPAAMEFGIHPIHFGIIMVTTIEIGLLTPPMAANIYVSAKVNKSSLIEMLPYVFWFLFGAIVVLFIVMFTPFLTTWFI